MFDLSSLTTRQREITEEAIRRTRFDYLLLQPGLQASVGKSLIPVEWIDLSRYAQQVETQKANNEHPLIEENGDKAEVIEFRNRTLGLAWYSGKVSIEITLENEPQLAMEVFLAEGAHMVDFFYMTDEMRRQIYNIYHDNDTTPHAHDWFDSGEYWGWVGESFMGGFMLAYSDIPLSLDNFSHKSTPERANLIRNILTPVIEPSVVTEPIIPPYGAVGTSKKFHGGNHFRSKWTTTFLTREAADLALEPCKTCKP